MASAFETLTKDTGRRGGLLLVWWRELERKLQINQYLPGCSRGYLGDYDRDEQMTRGQTRDCGL